MNKFIGAILIAVSIFLGYKGLEHMDSSSESLKIGELEISAQNESSRTRGYVYIGAGVIVLISGIYLLQKKNKA